MRNRPTKLSLPCGRLVPSYLPGSLLDRSVRFHVSSDRFHFPTLFLPRAKCLRGASRQIAGIIHIHDACPIERMGAAVIFPRTTQCSQLGRAKSFIAAGRLRALRSLRRLIATKPIFIEVRNLNGCLSRGNFPHAHRQRASARQRESATQPCYSVGSDVSKARFARRQIHKFGAAQIHSRHFVSGQDPVGDVHSGSAKLFIGESAQSSLLFSQHFFS